MIYMNKGLAAAAGWDMAYWVAIHCRCVYLHGFQEVNCKAYICIAIPKPTAFLYGRSQDSFEVDIMGVCTSLEGGFQAAAHAVLLVTHLPFQSGMCCCARYQKSGKAVR